jgi:hypothetical protein
MKVLIYIAAHFPYSTEKPVFVDFCEALQKKGHTCLVSLPKELKYLTFPNGVKKSFYHSKERRQSDGFFFNFWRLILDKHINSILPVSTIQELLWKPDAVFVFSDPFLDFEFYTNTWLFNVLHARNIKLFKICQRVPIYDENPSSELKSKHINSLSAFKTIYFFDQNTKRNLERQIGQSFQVDYLTKYSIKLKVSKSINTGAKRFICPLPSTCSIYKQDLIIEAWSRVFGDRKDVELCLNSFGKDTSFLKSYGQRFDVNILWKTTHKMLNSEACAIIMFSKFLNLYEFDGLLSNHKILTISNVENGLSSNNYHVIGATLNNLVYTFSLLKQKKLDKFSMLTLNENKSIFSEQLIEPIS